jgi:hypothetical protein
MPLTIADLTTNVTTDTSFVVTGDGVFDDLMETVDAHLDAQFKLGRITGTDYSTVYLGALQATLQQAVAYLLGQESTNAQVVSAGIQDALVTAQELKVDADIVSLGIQDGVTTKQGLLVDAQVISAGVQDGVAVKQGLKIDAEELLVDAQKLKVDAEELLVDKQALQVDAEIAVLDQKEITEWAATEQTTAIAPTSTSVIGIDGALKAAQIAKLGADQTAVADKAVAEVSLLGQKEVTEYSQTNQTTLTPAAAASTIGKQQTLYTEQAKGFQWNADQKYLKTLLDAWSINISTSGVSATGVTAINETGTGNINTQIANAEPI